MVEEDTQMELKEYRSFIDQEMITIMGQMDSASKIFDHVYLVSKLIFKTQNEIKLAFVCYMYYKKSQRHPIDSFGECLFFDLFLFI